MADEPKAKAEVKAEKGLRAFAAFELRGRQYKEGDVFVPPADFVEDAAMEEFRRVNHKRGARGKVYYYEVPPKRREDDAEIFRVVLPVE